MVARTTITLSVLARLRGPTASLGQKGSPATGKIEIRCTAGWIFLRKILATSLSKSRLVEDHGFTYIDNGEAQDIVVVDQIRGPMASCNWAKFARFDLDGDGKKMIVVGRLVGSDHDILMLPDGWDFENSLSATYSFVPTEHFEKSMTPR